MNGGESIPTPLGPEAGQGRITGLEGPEDTGELFRNGLATGIEGLRDHRFRDDSITLGHLQSLHAFIVGRLQEGIFLHAKLLEQGRGDLVQVAVHRIPLRGERIGERVHEPDFFLEHLLLAALSQYSEECQPELEGLVVLAGLEQAVVLSRGPAGDGLGGPVEIREVDRAEITIGRDIDHHAVHAPFGIDAVSPVGHAEEDLLFRGDDRLTHLFVGGRPVGNGIPVGHARPDGGQVEISACGNRRITELEIRLEERIGTSGAFRDRVLVEPVVQTGLQLRGLGPGRSDQQGRQQQ